MIELLKEYPLIDRINIMRKADTTNHYLMYVTFYNLEELVIEFDTRDITTESIITSIRNYVDSFEK
jgi:hypothetical protein